jgi:hypothetical protein
MRTESDIARSAKDVIDDAIRENSAAAWLMYAFAICFVSVGLLVLVIGVINRDTLVSAFGVVASSLFWPSMTAARRTRKENIAIRLLEAPLARADTAKDAAEMLHKLVNDIMMDRRSDGK